MATQLSYRHSGGRAYYDKKIAEGKTAKERVPAAIGVGDDSAAMAAWPAGDRGGVLVTRYQPGKAPHAGVETLASLRAHFVQPLPAGRILLVAARTPGTDNAEVWAAEGRCERTGLLGDAIEQALTTASGAVWARVFR